MSFAQQVEGALEMKPGGVLVAQGLFVIPWTVACQAPLFMGFSRQEYWSGLPFPSAGDLPQSGIKPRSPALQKDSLPSEPLGKALYIHSFLSLFVSVSGGCGLVAESCPTLCNRVDCSLPGSSVHGLL